jgi:hypothetical protein
MVRDNAVGRRQQSGSRLRRDRTRAPRRRHGRLLELRIDAKSNTARIQDQVIPLQGSNVVMIDDVDAATVRIAGTR